MLYLICLLLAFGVAGCGLQAEPMETIVHLYFTAPGDDGMVGQAQKYIVRYSTSAITDGNWNSATEVPASLIKTPKMGGLADTVSFAMTLESSTDYYFAIMACDEIPLCGGVSIPNKIITTSDVISPATITDLH